MAWEVDWAHEGNTGTRVWARNPSAHIHKAREWHWTTTGYLRGHGINTPIYRKDSWEIDWAKRNGKRVWARNLSSKMPAAREWHWIAHKTVDRAGLCWRPAFTGGGRWKTSNGYVNISRRAMTDDEIEIAEQYGLFRGKKKHFVKEHHLVAAIKYGGIPSRAVVRHVNGVKDDNRPENLILGTTQENTSDHVNARKTAMHWRNIAQQQDERMGALERRIEELERVFRVTAGMLKADPLGIVEMIVEALG